MFKRVGIVLFLICLGCLASITIYQELQAEAGEKPKNKAVVSREVKKAPRIQSITLTAAGDCLMHNTQIRSGLQADGTYRYEHFLLK